MLGEEDVMWYRGSRGQVSAQRPHAGTRRPWQCVK